MSGPQEFNISFSHLDKDYDLKLQKGGESAYSVMINGISYAILGEDEKLTKAYEILNSLDSISDVEDLKGKLSVLKDISFPTQKTDDIGIKTLKTSFIKTSNPVQANFPLAPRNIEMAKLVRMVKNITSDADVQALCRVCLAQNNNNSKLALESLKSAFYQAGVGTVSVKIKDMLINEALERNVDEIKAFGRKRTVEVTLFLKNLPQTANGAIDLTKMKKIGQGGNQDVYVLRNKPSPFVIKLNRASLEMKDNKRLEKYKTDNVSYQKLHDSFGDHCTVEQLLLRNVADGSDTKKAIISVADFEAGFKNESKVELQGADFDWNDLSVARNLDAYDEMLRSLFFEDASSFDISTIKTINPHIAQMANLISQDPFKKALTDFLTRFKEYFKKTDKPIWKI